MFEPVRSSLLDMFSGVEDAGVVAAIGVAAREENAAGAHRLEAMGELYARRAPEDDEERTDWLIDGYESLAAEEAAELGISRGRARGQLRYAIHLRDKLPQVMAVYLACTSMRSPPRPAIPLADDLSTVSSHPTLILP